MKKIFRNQKKALSEEKLFENLLFEQIEKMNPDQRKIWLPIFYDRYTERFFKDNEKIWSIGSIFIPLSLAGLAYLKDMSFVHTCLLGLGSMGLVIFWVIISENLRALQHKSQIVCRVIEVYSGIHINKGKIRSSPFIINKIEIRNVRWLTLIGVICVWVFAMYFAYLKEKEKIPYNQMPKDIFKYVFFSKIKQ